LAGIFMTRKIGNYLLSGIIAAVLSGGMTAYCFGEPNKVEDELRERCSKRSEEIWREKFGLNKISNKKGEHSISKYKNHYNAALGKCFYLTRSDIIGKKKVTKIERLFEVDDKKEYGSFTGGNEDSFHICVLFVGKATQKCSSEDEWRGLIKPYMEDIN
jgi:hypothetical protein